MTTGTKNFKISDFACKCGCGFDNIDQRVVDTAQKIRDMLGIPINIDSGCRCLKYDTRVNEKNNSYHTRGLAADLSCELGAKAIWNAIHLLWNDNAFSESFYAVLYKDYVHIDYGKSRKKHFEIRVLS